MSQTGYKRGQAIEYQLPGGTVWMPGRYMGVMPATDPVRVRVRDPVGDPVKVPLASVREAAEPVAEPVKGSPQWEDPRLVLPAPEKIRAAEMALRHAHGVMDPGGQFWLVVADYLNDASHIPELTAHRNRDWREFNRATQMAVAILVMLNGRTITIADEVAGRLPRDLSGVYWADTGFTECRPHLTGPGFGTEAQLQARLARAENGIRGVVLTGAITCDACTADAKAGRWA